ncbi:MAG: twin-arginine translocation signal domain-containing protein, partial [Nitrospiraceae bacterium]
MGKNKGATRRNFLKAAGITVLASLPKTSHAGMFDWLTEGYLEPTKIDIKNVSKDSTNLICFGTTGSKMSILYSDKVTPGLPYVSDHDIAKKKGTIDDAVKFVEGDPNFYGQYTVDKYTGRNGEEIYAVTPKYLGIS